MHQDLHSNIKVENVIPPEALTANTNSAVIDTAGFESLEYIIHVGAAMAGGGFTVTLAQGEESDLSDATDVPAEETLGDLPVIETGDTDKVFRVGVVGKKRYQAVSLIETGAITGGVVGVTAVLGHPRHAPVADQST